MLRNLTLIMASLLTAACGRESALVLQNHLEEAPISVAGVARAPTRDSSRAQTFDLTGRMLTRRAQLTVRVDTLERAVHRLTAIASTVNAIIASATEDRGARTRSASIELRVASEHFDRTIEGIRRLGSDEALQIETDDVGEEFVDLGARLSNGRRLESRLLALLATRTGKLSDVVAVERELARIRTELDGLEGRRRYLESHAALSTITVSLHEPYTVVGTTAPGVLSHALERSWENFVWLMSVLVQSLGVVVPLAILASVGWSLGLRARLRRALPAGGRPAAR